MSLITAAVRDVWTDRLCSEYDASEAAAESLALAVGADPRIALADPVTPSELRSALETLGQILGEADFGAHGIETDVPQRVRRQLLLDFIEMERPQYDLSPAMRTELAYNAFVGLRRAHPPEMRDEKREEGPSGSERPEEPETPGETFGGMESVAAAGDHTTAPGEMPSVDDSIDLSEITSATQIQQIIANTDLNADQLEAIKLQIEQELESLQE